jgi:hypothetical protein
MTNKSAKNPQMDSFCSKILTGEFAEFGKGHWSVKIEFNFFLSYINLMSLDNNLEGAGASVDVCCYEQCLSGG